MEVVCRQGQRAQPGSERYRQGSCHPAQRRLQPASPARQQLRRQQRVGSEQAVARCLQRRHQQRNAQHHQKRQLEAGAEYLLGIPQQDDEGSGGQRIHQVARPLQSPAADDDAHHHRGSDGGGLPAGRRGVEPDQRDDDPAAPNPRHLEHAQQARQDPRDQRDMQSADGKDVHRARAHERLIDLIGQRRLPAQRHRPDQAQGFVFLRQSARQRRSRPLQKPIAQRRSRPGVQQPPVIGRGSFELVVNPLPPQVGAVIEQALGDGDRRRRQDAGDLHHPAREDFFRQHRRRDDQDLAICRSPAGAATSQMADPDLRYGPHGFLRVPQVDPMPGRLAESAAHRYQLRRVPLGQPQVVRRNREPCAKPGSSTPRKAAAARGARAAPGARHNAAAARPNEIAKRMARGGWKHSPSSSPPPYTNVTPTSGRFIGCREIILLRRVAR